MEKKEELSGDTEDAAVKEGENEEKEEDEEEGGELGDEEYDEDDLEEVRNKSSEGFSCKTQPFMVWWYNLLD